MDKHQQKFIDKLRLSDTLEEASQHRNVYVAHLISQARDDIVRLKQFAPEAIEKRLCELTEAIRRGDRAVGQFVATYVKHKIFPSLPPSGPV